MKNPAPPAVCCAVCSDDRPGYCLDPAGLGCWFGTGIRLVVRLFAPLAAEDPLACRPDLYGGSVWGLGISEFWCMPGRYPNGGYRHHGAGGLHLGNDHGTDPKTPLFHGLEVDWMDF